jgi:hypothetical protein
MQTYLSGLHEQDVALARITTASKLIVTHFHTVLCSGWYGHM